MLFQKPQARILAAWGFYLSAKNQFNFLHAIILAVVKLTELIQISASACKEPKT